jgi:hypothetical protein
MDSTPFLNDNDPTQSGTRVISVQKARRILGSLANSMNDTQVKELIHFLHLLAKEQLVYTGSKDERYNLKISNST